MSSYIKTLIGTKWKASDASIFGKLIRGAGAKDNIDGDCIRTIVVHHSVVVADDQPGSQDSAAAERQAAPDL